MSVARRKPRTPDVCPVCSHDVPRGALACPECGADHQSGWREDAENYDALDLPGDDFDYDEFVQKEFGPSSRPSLKPEGMKTIWWITAIVILVVSVVLYLLSLR
jgi:hypothetical protein